MSHGEMAEIRLLGAERQRETDWTDLWALERTHRRRRPRGGISGEARDNVAEGSRTSRWALGPAASIRMSACEFWLSFYSREARDQVCWE